MSVCMKGTYGLLVTAGCTANASPLNPVFTLGVYRAGNDGRQLIKHASGLIEWQLPGLNEYVTESVEKLLTRIEHLLQR